PELHQQRTQVSSPPVVPAITAQSMPPPISVPFPTMPQSSQQQFYHPFSTQGPYPYPYPLFPPVVEQKKMCTYKQFMDCKPPEYHGSPEPNVTLNWLREMVKVLDACNCEEELRVRFATRMLKGDAMVWWDSLTTHLTKEHMDSITWDQFHGKLCEQYCNEFEMRRIRREFMDLKMTEKMSVDEMIKQFNEKLRFVKQWVPDEHSQIQHFIGALLPEYRSVARLAGTLSQTFTLAKSAENDVKAREKMDKDKITSQKQKGDQSGSQQKKKWQGNQNHKFSVGGSSQRSSWCQKCKSSHTGPCTPQTNRCIRCGQFGHTVNDCRFPRNVCWNCQQEGHRAGECTYAKKTGTGSGSGAVAVGGSPSAVGQKRKNPPSAEGRAFRMTVDDAMTTDDVITGMFLINSVPARVLFDTGANRSFISVTFCDKLKLPTFVLSHPTVVEVADGKTVPVTTSVTGAQIDIDGKYFPVSFLLMPIPGF